MTRICFIEPSGTLYEVDAQDGVSAMEAAVRNGVPGIPADCGGACACATCHVYVDATWLSKLPEAGDIESDLLEIADDRRDNSRLSCQIVVAPELDGMVLRLSAEV
jgi:2Fe-2S ferredoxin